MGHLNHSKLVNYLKATIEQTKDLTSTSGDWTINIWDTLCWFEVISGDLWPGFGHIAVAKARFLDEGRRNGRWSRQRPTVSSDFSVKSSAQGRIADTISAEIHFFFCKSKLQLFGAEWIQFDHETKDFDHGGSIPQSNFASINHCLDLLVTMVNHYIVEWIKND